MSEVEDCGSSRLLWLEFIVFDQPEGRPDTPPVFIENSSGFIRQGCGNVDADFAQSFDGNRIDSMRKFGRVVTWDAVALEQALDNGCFAISPNSGDNDWSFSIHPCNSLAYPTTS